MISTNTIILVACFSFLLVVSAVAWNWYLRYGRNRIFRKLVSSSNNIVSIIHPKSSTIPHADEPSSDVVVILGWAGAELRHLRRIQEQYRQRQFTTISYIIPSIVYLDRGVSPHLLSPLFSELHDHMQSLPTGKRDKATIHIHTFSTGIAAYSTFMHVLRFFPRLNKHAPDLSYLLKHVAGVLYDSLLPIDGLRHVVVPTDFSQSVSEILSPITALPTPQLVPHEDTRLDLRSEHMANPLYILYHAYTMATYVTGLVLTPDRLFHLFWTPLITALFAFHYCIARFTKPIRALLSRLGLARPDRIRARYSAFPNELGPHYMPRDVPAASGTVNPEFIRRAPGGVSDSGGDCGAEDMELDIETGDAWMVNCSVDADTCNMSATRDTRGRTAVVDPHCGITSEYQLISFARMIHALVENPYPVPVLFLYSLEDTRMSNQDIERLMYVHVRKEVPVYKASFPTGDHCGIILKQFEDYVMAVHSFTAQMGLRKRIELDAARTRAGQTSF